MQTADLSIETAVMATLATVLMIGLGFLRNPTRATRLWALSFIVVMLGSYGAIAGEVTGLESLRVASMGVILVGPTLLWSGVRAKFGKSSLAWVSLVQGVLSVGLLVLLIGSPYYMLGFRVVFAVSASFAALTAAELISSPQRGLNMLLPLTIVSAIFPMLALASLIITLRALTDGSDDLVATTTVNVLAMPVYMVCAIVTLLALSGSSQRGADVGWTSARPRRPERSARPRRGAAGDLVVAAVHQPR